jgi:putative transposase
LVDTHGLLRTVVVHAANISDREGGHLVFNTLGQNWLRLQHIWADQGSTGALRAWAAQTHGRTLAVVYPSWRQLAR